MDDLRHYAGRMVVPILLLGASIVLWLISSQLGSNAMTNDVVVGATERTPSAVPMSSIRRAPIFAAASQQDGE